MFDPPTNPRGKAILPMMSVQLRIHRQPNPARGIQAETRTMHVTAPAAIVVGRHSSCDVHIEGDDVSRQHARIILGADSFTAEDLSSNGTKTSAGEVLRRTRAMYPYGTFLEIGPYRIAVGHSQMSQTAIAGNGNGSAKTQLQAPAPHQGELGAQISSAVNVAVPTLGMPRINARGSSTPTRGVAVIHALTPSPGGTQFPQTPSPGGTQFPQTPSPGGTQFPQTPQHLPPTPTPTPQRSPLLQPTALMAPAPAPQQPAYVHQPSVIVDQPMQPMQQMPMQQMQMPLQQQPMQPSIAPTAATPQQTALQDLKMSEELLSLRRKVHAELLKNLDFAKIDPTKADPGLRPRVLTALKRIVQGQNAPILDRIDRDAFIGELLEEALGLGPLEPLLADPSVTEIMVVDPATIYVERAGKLELTTTRFTDEERVRAVIERIVTPLGRRIDESQPLVDARLPDGSRVNAIIRPLALRGSCITIRRFPKRRLTVDDFIRLGSVTPRIARFLERAVIAKKNILISGGTGSGKTTLLNVLSASIPSVERIVTIEDAAELQLHQPHVVSLETKHANMEGRGAFTIRDLVKNALRMRPDRIVVGECRGGEALDMLQAMNTGHDGSLTTIHANSPVEALSRLETLVLMAGLELPSHAIREQIARSIHIIVQQSRCSDGSRKITAVSEIDELDPQTGQFEVRPIFEFEQTGVKSDGTVVGDFQATGYLPSFIDELMTRGLIKPGEAFL